LEAVDEPTGPPEATLKRRAQSYSDFHDTVKAVLGKEAALRENDERVHVEKLVAKKEALESELDFVDWYHHLEQELLISSHDDYTLGYHKH